MKVLKVLGFIVGAVILIVVLAAGGVYWKGGSELKRIVALPTHTFTAPTDSASIARGEHFVRAIGKCGDCHGADFGGFAVLEDSTMGLVYAANLTRGQGGIPADFNDNDWERAIRHGLAKDGRRLLLMPSQEFQHISDEDLGTVIAYLKSVPPVDKERRPHIVRFLPRALGLAGILPLYPYELVAHGEEVVATVPVDTTVAYGGYLAEIGCAGCHGFGFGGGPIPGGPPDWPPPANLTTTGIGHYTYEGFANALRTGKRPDGSAINPFMPIGATARMTDTEIKATWNYLRSLPPKEYGSR
jgi:mono/diheme cytochrome c family protein